MKERILQFLALEHISPTRFADLLGVQRSGVSHILAGRNKPSCDFIEKMLLSFPNLSAEWLLRGKGDIYKAAAGAMLQEIPLFENTPEKKQPVSAPPPSLPEKNEPEKGDSERINSMKTVEPQHVAAQHPEKTVESITIFYADKTFCTYRPE
jgi:plasmid maintenance system antidote protein VapI